MSFNRLTKRGRINLGMYSIFNLIGLTLDTAGIYLISVYLQHWTSNKNSIPAINFSDSQTYLYFAVACLLSRSLCMLFANVYFLRRLATEESLIAIENYEQWQSQPLPFRESTEPSLLKINVVQSPNTRVQFVLVKSVSIVCEFLNIISLFLIIGFIDIYVSAGSILFYFAVGSIQHRYLSKANNKVGQKNRESLSKVWDLLDIAYRLTTILEVMPSRSFNSTLFSARQDLANAEVNSNLLNLLPRLTLEISLFGGISFVVGLAKILDSKTDIALTLGLFALLSFRLIPILSSVQSGLSQIQRFLPFLDKDTTSATHTEQDLHWSVRSRSGHQSSIQSTSKESQIFFNNVKFEYPNSSKPALKDINLQLKKGLIYVLAGPNGCGKSTLLKLLMGSLKPTSGSISLDNRTELVIGLVPQSTDLFNGTIAQNVALEWDSDLIDFELISNLYLSFPNAQVADSDFTSNEVNELSGGQQQILSLMRAMYRSPNLLLLDEANSLLDDATEDLFNKLIHQDKINRFTVLISHRIAPMLNADAIIWMNSGKILDIGTFSELSNRQPNFDLLLDRVSPR